MTDKTIFNGDEDGQKPTEFDKGGLLPPGVVQQFITPSDLQIPDQMLWDRIPTPEPEYKPSKFGKIIGRTIAFAITMVVVAGCIWLVAAIIANLPTR